MNTQILELISTILLSGLTATFITIWHGRRSETKANKSALFQQLLANRSVLIPGPHNSDQAIRFTEALNKIFVVYQDSQKVIKALGGLYEAMMSTPRQSELGTDRLLQLLKTMAQELKVNYDALGDRFFLRAFQIPASAEAIDDELHFQGPACVQGQLVVVRTVPTSGGRRPILIPIEQAKISGCVLIEMACLAEERQQELRSTGQVLDVATLVNEFNIRVQARAQLNRTINHT